VRARSAGGGPGRPELTADCHAFRGTLGAKVLVCKPADPEAKGLIERAHDYLERSFLPGRTFTGPADFNAQLQSWLSWSTGGSGGRWAAPRPTGSSPTAPRCSAAAGRAGHRLAGLDPPGRDHYVRLDSNDYSITRR
jgi:hypothetical protein